MLLPHIVTIVTPAASADAYGTAGAGLDYGPAAGRRQVPAFVQPTDASQIFDGQLRQAEAADWTMFTRDTGITSTDRVEWNGQVLNVNGVRALDGPSGAGHHCEIRLRSVAG